MPGFPQRNTGEAANNPMRDRMRKILEVKKAQGGSSSGGRFYNMPKEVKFFKPTKEEHYLDIIPYKTTVDRYVGGELIPKGTLWYERTYYKHNSIGVNKQKVVCLRSVGKACPVCEYQAELRRSGGSKKDIDALKSTETQLFNIIDLEEEAKGVQLWDKATFHFGQTLDREIRNQGAKNYEFLDFYLPDAGFTLKVRMIDKPFNNKPNFQTTAVDFLPRQQQYDPRVIDKAVNLDTVLEILTYDQLKALLFGNEGPIHVAPTEPETPASEVSFRLPPKPVAQPAQTSFQRQVAPATQAPEPEAQAPVSDNPCPFGHEFGTDNGVKEECDQKCDETWEACYEKKQELERQAHASRRVQPKRS